MRKFEFWLSDDEVDKLVAEEMVSIIHDDYADLKLKDDKEYYKELCWAAKKIFNHYTVGGHYEDL